MTSDRLLGYFGWGLLAFLILGLVPLFVCMPLWVDTIQYDIHARNMLTGGIPYEQSSDSNLPGIQWIQTGIRAMIGWGSESMRIVDLLIVAFEFWLILRWLPAGVDRVRTLWVVVALTACYLLSPEMVHCQRDVWMVALALMATGCRYGQCEPTGRSAGLRFGLSIVEGLVWGLCVWIKPHALVLGVGVYVTGVWLAYRNNLGWKRMLLDAGGLFLGGIAIGAAGIVWLWTSGAWNHFWEVLLVWSKDYVANQKSFVKDPDRLYLWSLKFFPWSIVPWAAAFLAGKALVRPVPTQVHPLYAILFLVWFVQGFFLQVPHEYVLMPILLLGSMIVVSSVRISLPAIAFAVLLGLTLAPHGLTKRFAQSGFGETWLACVTRGATPEMKNRLAMNRGGGQTDWVALEKVADYLRRQNVADGELTCFHAGTHPLFLMLEIKPSIKHIQPNVGMLYFPSHLEEIRQELSESKHRFTVSDLQWTPLPFDEARAEGEAKLPDNFPDEGRDLFPWCEPVVFRAGPYLIHRITEPTRRFWNAPK